MVPFAVPQHSDSFQGNLIGKQLDQAAAIAATAVGFSHFVFWVGGSGICRHVEVHVAEGARHGGRAG